MVHLCLGPCAFDSAGSVGVHAEKRLEDYGREAAGCGQREEIGLV